MHPVEPPATVATDLVLLALYVGVALAVSLYVWVTFVGPWLRDRSAPDYEARTRDLLQRHRAQELNGEPDYLLPGEASEPATEG